MNTTIWHHSKISVAFLFIVASIGTLLRSVSFIDLPFSYGNLVHAHSHVAFQGWVYTSMILILPKLFLSKDQIAKGRYLLQFQITIPIIIGILISFSLQGYGLYSIIFSTLFQGLNYWFIYQFLRDSKSLSPTLPLQFIKWGLYLGLLSTLFPFIIGFLSAKGYANTELYESFIYTFMHLQYNGWFLFVAIGLFIKLLELHDIKLLSKHALVFFNLFSISILPAISLSLIGMSFKSFFLPFAYVSAILQVLAVYHFIRAIPATAASIFNRQTFLVKLFFFVFLISFTLKFSIQFLSIFPFAEEIAFHNKPIILSYLHLSLIGVISCLYLGIMFLFNWIPVSTLSINGGLMFLAGFLCTELLLVLNGLNIFSSDIALALGSFLMMLGILSFLFCSTSNSNYIERLRNTHVR
jgi:hypothetical protein